MKQPILDQEEIDAYHRDGFLVPNFRLSGAKLARLQRLTDELLERNAEFGDTPMVCPHVPGGGVQGAPGTTARSRGTKAQSDTATGRSHKTFATYATPPSSS